MAMFLDSRPAFTRQPLLRAAGPCRVLTEDEVIALTADTPLLPPGVCSTAGQTAEVRHGGALEGLLPAPVCAAVAQTPTVRHGGALPLLPPAPLPSLTAAFSRRRAIFGAVALAAAPVAALPAAAMAIAPGLGDARFVEMQRQAMALKAYSDHPDTDGEIGDAAYTASSDIQGEAISMTVTTPAGALASLLWGREEFNSYYIEKSDDSDWLDRFTLRMIDNAIAVLRSQVAHA